LKKINCENLIKGNIMEQLNKSKLSSIAGGMAGYRNAPAPVLASIAQVSARARDMIPSNDANGDAAPYCNQYSHKAVTPKNGDRNNVGQVYSWGTWWDDAN
jgi:hypothetical protein